MKTIQPVTTWNNGQTVQAKVLNAIVASDNLSTQAVFSYSLFEENDNLMLSATVAQGQLVMTGADYLAYETNNYAWDWVANSLGLTITGDYIPPVPTTTTTTTEAPVETTTTTIAP